MAAKLDMTKAYNRVEWNFLEGIMEKLGFARRWVNMIMSYVRSIIDTIVINGHQCGEIVPTRGLRQGDPLSPYLFLLCTKGLVSLLKRAVQSVSN